MSEPTCAKCGGPIPDATFCSLLCYLRAVRDRSPR